MKGEKKPLQAKFYGTDKKMDIHSKEEMDKLLASLKDKEYEINEVKKGERIKNAPQMCIRDSSWGVSGIFTCAQKWFRCSEKED